ncbi:glycosyltransferase family 117 protein [Labilibacter marinus]|uniref:glycosyltransferase family 117 protein n=1 Tax=Labilibacter marinus TaxID=1477105 RepID=UPI00094FB8A0|nr:DUF2723 domain-containing protein [Labilibacter marinus]
MIGGSFVFILSFLVYNLTLSPTVSFWDCGEFIACANKLEVGHAPGAPFYLMMSRALSFSAVPQNVAYCINLFSAFASALTVCLLYGSLIIIFQKINKDSKNIINHIAAIIASLSFAFTDSFWFSAVEAEVYALSLFFTAFTVWAVLKWELEYSSTSSHRYLLLIAFCLGVSVGVHLLNLLCIPVVTYWVYIHIKREQKHRQWIGLALGFIVLVLVQFLVIQNGLWLAKYVELLFVNTFNWPVHSGLVFYVFTLITLLVAGIYLTHKRAQLLNFALVATLLFTIGVSSYAMVIIRANAQPGINLNNPSQVFSLESFLNRDQYGQRPLLRGAWFGAERISYEPKSSYRLNEDNQYESYDKGGEVVYKDEDVAWLQRMYSSQEHHINGYRYWSQLEAGEKPSFGHQLDYLFKYQLGHMYFRYFMWNFSGRQNHYQGHGDFLGGNFTTGFSFLDKYSLGSRNYKHAKELISRGSNKYFMLPLIFGLLGILFLVRMKQWDLLVLLGSLFVITGIAIAFYLNQPPMEPRERDYVFVGSFYAFCMFIGLAIWAVLNKVMQSSSSRLTTLLVALILALGLPGILFANNFNDHNRSDRTLASDLAKSYLNSCELNSILFTYGDNDTYPLWYIQEVEEFRQDIRVINLGLLSADWYVQQQTLAQEGSKPLKYTIPLKRYIKGDLDYAAVVEKDIALTSMSGVLSFVGDNSEETQLQTRGGSNVDFIPQKSLVLNGDSTIRIHINKSYLMKGEIAFLDLVSSNHENRPIYFANGTPKSAMLGFEQYLQTQGMVSKLIGSKPLLDEGQLYELLMHKINIAIPQNSWWDESGDNAWKLTRLHTASLQLANLFIEVGELAKAKALLNKYYALEMMLINTSYKQSLIWIETLYKCGLNEKALRCLDRVSEISIQNLNFYLDSESNLGNNMSAYANEEQAFLTQLNKLAIEIEANDMANYIQSLINY